MQKQVGDIAMVAIMVTLPVPVHGVSCEVQWGSGLSYIPTAFAWGDMPEAEQVKNITTGGLYIERALGPEQEPVPAGRYTLASLQFKCITEGQHGVNLANMQAGIYRNGEVTQLGVEGKNAQYDIVLQGIDAVVLFEVVAS